MCHDIRSEHSSRGEVRRWIAVAPTNSRLVLTFLTQSAHTQQTQPQVRNITAMTGIISILSRHLPRSVQNAGLKAVRNHEVSPPHGGVIHIDRYASTCILVYKRDTQKCSLKGATEATLQQQLMCIWSICSLSLKQFAPRLCN